MIKLADHPFRTTRTDPHFAVCTFSAFLPLNAQIPTPCTRDGNIRIGVSLALSRSRIVFRDHRHPNP